MTYSQTPQTHPVDWEAVEQNDRGPSMLARAAVPGGWLVWAKSIMGSAHMSGLSFVPDPDHTWLKVQTETPPAP